MRGKNLRFGEKRYAGNWEMGAAFTKFPWGVHPSLIPLGSRGLAHAGLSSFDDINAAYPTDATSDCRGPQYMDPTRRERERERERG